MCDTEKEDVYCDRCGNELDDNEGSTSMLGSGLICDHCVQSEDLLIADSDIY